MEKVSPTVWLMGATEAKQFNSNRSRNSNSNQAPDQIRDLLKKQKNHTALQCQSAKFQEATMGIPVGCLRGKLLQRGCL